MSRLSWVQHPKSRNDRQRGHLLLFFASTYAGMWACLISVAAVPIPSPYRGMLVLLGAYSPSLVAVSLTALDQGCPGVRSLIGRAVQWRVSARYYVFAPSYVAALKLLVAAVLRVTTGALPRFGADPWYIIVAAVVLSTPFQAGEELGWRGYALPRLAGCFGIARASILLGLIWAFWHLPQFFVRESDTYGHQ